MTRARFIERLGSALSEVLIEPALVRQLTDAYPGLTPPAGSNPDAVAVPPRSASRPLD
ncbi:MAG: hypothetical protein AAGC80_31090 [Rhodococcus sp. (in: high G+C Gram-positive bacteria)]